MPTIMKLKKKYLSASHGHYKSNHNMSGHNKRKKTGKQPILPGIRTMVILPSGKSRMEWR